MIRKIFIFMGLGAAAAFHTFAFFALLVVYTMSIKDLLAGNTEMHPFDELIFNVVVAGSLVITYIMVAVKLTRKYILSP